MRKDCLMQSRDLDLGLPHFSWIRTSQEEREILSRTWESLVKRAKIPQKVLVLTNQHFPTKRRFVKKFLTSSSWLPLCYLPCCGARLEHSREEPGFQRRWRLRKCLVGSRTFCTIGLFFAGFQASDFQAALLALRGVWKSLQSERAILSSSSCGISSRLSPCSLEALLQEGTIGPHSRQSSTCCRLMGKLLV